MVDFACSDLTAFASWPVATVHDGRRGPVAGIVLPRVSNHDQIHTLYSPAHRKLKYPDKDWSFLVHVAMNCAAAFASIHEKSHLIADVNQGNVLVSPNGTVFLIDRDSFQVAADGGFFSARWAFPTLRLPSCRGSTCAACWHGKPRLFRPGGNNLSPVVPGASSLCGSISRPRRHAAGAGDPRVSLCVQQVGVLAASGGAANTLPMEAIAPSVACLFEAHSQRAPSGRGSVLRPNSGMPL